MNKNKAMKILTVIIALLIGTVYAVIQLRYSDIDTGDDTDDTAEYIEYHFRNEKYLNSHYKKHGIEMGFTSAEEYEKAASDVINSAYAMHKIEKENGDGVYYIMNTNEFVVLSFDGYIRTYFNPTDGIDYYNRQ